MTYVPATAKVQLSNRLQSALNIDDTDRADALADAIANWIADWLPTLIVSTTGTATGVTSGPSAAPTVGSGGVS